MAAMTELEDSVKQITLDEYSRWENFAKERKNITQTFDDPDPEKLSRRLDTQFGFTQKDRVPGLEALNRNGIKVCHLNIGGLGKKLWKLERVKEWLNKDNDNSKDVVVFAITETKLKPPKETEETDEEKEEKNLEIPGYKYRRIDNQFRNCTNGCGGQLIYFDESLSTQIFRMGSELSLDESLKGWVECSIMKVEKFKFIVCVFYVNPEITKINSKIILFFDYFKRIVKLLSEQKTRVFILGDFNIDLIRQSLKKSYMLKIAEEFGFKQVQQKITREATNTNLDHIYLRCPVPDTAKYRWDRVNVNPVGGGKVSDHHLTYISFSF